MSVIAIDIGTSSIKAGLFSQEGQLYSSISLPSPSAASGPMASGECDAEEWVESCEILLQKTTCVAFESLKGDPISCLCVSGNGPSLVAVGADDKAVMPVLLWIDRRAKEEAREISSRIGSEVDPAFYLPKVLWILRNRQSLVDRIRYFMPCPEFLSFRLSGRPHAVLPSPFFENYIWSPALLERLGLPADKFPPLLPPGAIIGKVKKDVAQRTGLPADCSIASGLPDFMAAQLGSGVVETGLALDRTGSSEALNLCAEKVFPDNRLFSTPHSVPGLWNISGGISTSGSAVAWLDGILRPGETRENGDALDDEMEAAGPGSGGLLFLPYLRGERAPLWNPDIRGAIVGLDLSHGRGHISRALLESIAFALREVIDILDQAGFGCRAVHASGGTLTNSFWLRLKADILKRPIVVPAISETELAGAASLALAALGAYPSARVAACAIFKAQKTIEPDPKRSAVYDECYGRFLDARKGIESLPIAPWLITRT
jgi:xylulokinase